MSDSYEKRDTLPLTWWGRMPVYATTIIVLLDLLGMFFTVFHSAAHYNTIETFGFSPQAFWKGWAFWQFFTYPLVNAPSFFYIFGLFFLYGFGIGVESYLGRRVYLRLVFLLMLVQPFFCTVFWMITGFSPVVFGIYEISIGIFIANATLYPNAEYWNWITMKWLAFAGLVLCSLTYVPDRNWGGLALLLSVCGTAHALVRYERGHWTFPTIRLPKRKPKFRVVPKPAAAPRAIPRQEVADDFTDVEVDALLDKIAKSGIASLTPSERARLEKAREELLKKERQ